MFTYHHSKILDNTHQDTDIPPGRRLGVSGSAGYGKVRLMKYDGQQSGDHTQTWPGYNFDKGLYN